MWEASWSLAWGGGLLGLVPQALHGLGDARAGQVELQQTQGGEGGGGQQADAAGAWGCGSTAQHTADIFCQRLMFVGTKQCVPGKPMLANHTRTSIHRGFWAVSKGQGGAAPRCAGRLGSPRHSGACWVLAFSPQRGKSTGVCDITLGWETLPFF